MELTGIFQITNWDEKVQQTFSEEMKLSIALVEQSYTGAIVGNGSVSYQLFYDKNGNAKFNGFETITYDIEGEQAMITLMHDGTFESGMASSKFCIIESSHDEALIGKSGSFNSIEGGQAKYKIS